MVEYVYRLEGLFQANTHISHPQFALGEAVCTFPEHSPLLLTVVSVAYSRYLGPIPWSKMFTLILTVSPSSRGPYIQASPFVSVS